MRDFIKLYNEYFTVKEYTVSFMNCVKRGQKYIASEYYTRLSGVLCFLCYDYKAIQLNEVHEIQDTLMRFAKMHGVSVC